MTSFRELLAATKASIAETDPEGAAAATIGQKPLPRSTNDPLSRFSWATAAPPRVWVVLPIYGAGATNHYTRTPLGKKERQVE